MILQFNNEEMQCDAERPDVTVEEARRWFSLTRKNYLESN